MLAARSGLSPIMVGRSGPLAGCGRCCWRSTRRATAVALITGEAGVGKTRLFQEFIAGAAAEVLVFAGAAEPGALGRPYEVVRALLGGSFRPTASHSVVDASLARSVTPGAWSCSRTCHWADAESVDVFERLAAAALPATLVVGHVPAGGADARLPGGEMLERLERRHFVHHVHLDRLGRAEVGGLPGSVHGKVPPSGVVDTLHGRTGGNPFFLEELLNVAGDIDPAELDRQPLPWSLAELVRAQLDGSTSDERRVVEAAAVLGRRAGSTSWPPSPVAPRTS